MNKKLDENTNLLNHETIGYSYVPLGNYVSIGAGM